MKISQKYRTLNPVTGREITQRDAEELLKLWS